MPDVDYILIDDSEVEPGAPILSSLGVRWRDNAIAIAQGAPGAPRIDGQRSPAVLQGGIVNGGVGQAQLKTSESTNSNSGSGFLTVTVPGGNYAFWPRYWVNNTTTTSNWRFASSTSSNNQAIGASVDTAGGNSRTMSVRSRFVQSSPPYDLGDGQVHGFVYARLGSSGEVKGVYISEDPAHYGTTWGGTPEYINKDGKLCGRWKKPPCTAKDVIEGRATIEQICQSCTVEELEITPQTKLRGIDEKPHPWAGELEQDETAVLLDPMSDTTGWIIERMLMGDQPDDLLREGYLIIDNTPLKRGAPPGVPACAVKWKG